METKAPELKYCLYARKSSESDERQAMSIDSQLTEMRLLAESEHLDVVAEKQESFSAKSQVSAQSIMNFSKALGTMNIMPS